MISEGTRKLDLYDFFSVLLPGVYFIGVFSPFLPKQIGLSSVEVGVVVLISGYIVGRLLHVVAVEVENSWTLTHREVFIQEVDDPDILTEPMTRRFYRSCISAFNLTPEEDDREWERGEQNEDLLRNYYVLVRSYVHIDARGRSRTFQALHAFFRGLFISSLLATIFYYIYGLSLLAGLDAFDPGIYTPLISSADLSGPLVATLAPLTGLIITQLSDIALEQNKNYFVEYLIADFVTLQQADYPEAIVTAHDASEFIDE